MKPTYIFLFPYIALISVFAPQMALLGFIFPLFISPGTCHLMVEDYSHACQRERERGKEKERRRKSPEKNHFAETWIGTHGLCLQSRACYPLGHGALPLIDTKNYTPKKRNKTPLDYNHR